VTLFSKSTQDTIRRPARCSFARRDEFGELRRELGGWCPVELVYDPADPFAVALKIPVENGIFCTWLFSRELLNDGLLGCHELPAGDVRVVPEAYYPEVRIELSSPDGRGLLWLPVDQVSAFLAASYERVPAGTEAARIDWASVLPLAGTGSAGGAR
jgi:hypothetical protein